MARSARNDESHAQRQGNTDGSRPQITGTVVRIITDRGFCFLKDSHGKEYFCHLSALVDCAMSDLSQGDRVQFEEEPSPKGPRAANVRLL